MCVGSSVVYPDGSFISQTQHLSRDLYYARLLCVHCILQLFAGVVCGRRRSRRSACKVK